MFPIYGLGVLLEPLYLKIKGYPWVIRGLIWTILIYIIELTTGYVILNMTGVYAWNYSGAAYNYHGLIRLDYAPAWFILGLFLEKVYNYLYHKGIN